ncbi:MAG TPA: PAS domain-containing sensor histidine kinase, partial [Tenuifilaceae bacterium]|nr:PAS domain-containing sensor histidine kinase [Tenuifilaceae bacterium]
ALIIKSVEADGVIIKSAIKIGGEKILNTASPVSPEAYKRITSNKIELLDSFTEVSFGAIPESTNQMLKKLTGINNIYALALIVSGKLYGTTMLAFKKNQKLPSNELLKSYSHLVALTLRRSIAEKALIINENQLRCITDNISDVVFTTDMDLNTKYVSPSIFKLTGETPEAYINKKIERKHPIDSLRLIKSALTEELEKEKNPSIDKKRTRIIEVELYKKDGSKIYVSTHLSFIRDNQGNAIGFQGITRDITKRKLAEMALLESRKKLNTVVETIPDLLFHFNREGKFVNFYQTSKTHQLFIEPSNFIGKSIYEVLDKPLADKIQKAINKTLHKNSYEFEYETYNGEMKYFHARCAQLNEHEIIIISSDISKLKKTENQLKQNSKELKQLNAAKDRFMQILAHDLRNPFNVLLGFSELLIRNFKNYDDDLIKYYLDIIKQTSERTYLMLDELLLWSKSQAGKLPFEPSNINLSELIASIYSETKTNAQRKNITIKLSVPDNFQIIADGNMLKTVIRNLVSNAIKFTRKDGEITIDTHLDDSKVVIAIADNGIGISKTDQEKLWNNSNPHSTVGTDNEKGTGLGLLLCKDFVEKHGGKIWVESEEGFGSNFKIQLPLLN